MNVADDLPPDLKAFVFTCIDTVEQVELLTTLRRHAAPRSAGSLAAELGINAAATRHHLETLAARGLLQIEVAGEVTYGFHPRTEQLRSYAERLLDFYGASRITVIQAIAQSGRGTLKAFADAFKLRGDT